MRDTALIQEKQLEKRSEAASPEFSSVAPMITSPEPVQEEGLAATAQMPEATGLMEVKELADSAWPLPSLDGSQSGPERDPLTLPVVGSSPLVPAAQERETP